MNDGRDGGAVEKSVGGVGKGQDPIVAKRWRFGGDLQPCPRSSKRLRLEALTPRGRRLATGRSSPVETTRQFLAKPQQFEAEECIRQPSGVKRALAQKLVELLWLRR